MPADRARWLASPSAHDPARWRCCANAFDENGNRIPQVDQRRRLVVAEAGQKGTGFIYLQDWSDKRVPDGFADDTVRAISEDAKTLRFKQ